jgi:tyrosine-protein kinase Etk/Wzc
MHASNPAGDTGIDLIDLLLVIARDWRRIGLITLAAVVAGGLLSLILRPTFTASAIIMPPQQQQSSATALLGQITNLSLLGGGSGLGLKSPADMYVGILQSRTIGDRLISQFHLQSVYKTNKEQDTRNALRAHAQFEAAKDGLIHITFVDNDPNRASEIANGYVDALYQLNSTLAVTEAAQRRVFFDQQLTEERRALAAAETDLKNTEQKTGVIQLTGQASTIIRGIADLQAQIKSREVQIQGMRTYATEQNPDLVRLLGEIETLRQQLTSLESDQRRIQPGDVQMPAGQVPQAELEYSRKLRELKYHETLFDLLSRQYEAARIDEAKSAPVIQVIDRAIPPDKKSGPHRMLIALGSGILAFLAACLRSCLVYGVRRMEEIPEYAIKFQQLRDTLRWRR